MIPAARTRRLAVLRLAAAPVAPAMADGKPATGFSPIPLAYRSDAGVPKVCGGRAVGRRSRAGAGRDRSAAIQ